MKSYVVKVHQLKEMNVQNAFGITHFVKPPRFVNQNY